MPSSGQRLAVLVVDDEEDLLDLLQDNLSDDFEVVTAGSGRAAKDVLAQREIDVIVTDLIMPGMDGLDLYEHVRRNGPPVIFMTAYAERIEGKTPEDKILLKPFDLDSLRLLILQAAAS